MCPTIPKYDALSTDQISTGIFGCKWRRILGLPTDRWRTWRHKSGRTMLRICQNTRIFWRNSLLLLTVVTTQLIRLRKTSDKYSSFPQACDVDGSIISITNFTLFGTLCDPVGARALSTKVSLAEVVRGKASEQLHEWHTNLYRYLRQAYSKGLSWTSWLLRDFSFFPQWSDSYRRLSGDSRFNNSNKGYDKRGSHLAKRALTSRQGILRLKPTMKAWTLASLLFAATASAHTIFQVL